MTATHSSRGGNVPGDQPAWHTLEIHTVEALLGTSAHGLSQAEVQARLTRYGPNQLADVPPTNPLFILLHQFQSPLIYILLLAAVVTVLLGEHVDAGVIAVVLLLNAAIGFTQEYRAETSVRALMRLLVPRARVVREGRVWEIDSRELVPGDLVLLESGARVPADLRLIATSALTIDESLLTGESVPVTKGVEPLDRDVLLADRTNLAFMGTVVTQGRGRGYVVATGAATELGQIAAQVRGAERAETPLQRRMTQFARVIGIVVVVAATLAFGIGVAVGEHPADMFLVAVALAVAAVPEGLPVAFTITLALSVHRMARRHAIVRRLAAVETLGSTTVIGSDKTGTLTENRMTVQAIWAGGQIYTLASEGMWKDSTRPASGEAVAEHRPLYLTVLTGILTNEAQIYRTRDGYESQGDPTEVALLIAAAKLGIDPEQARAAHPVYGELPFEPERQYSASIRLYEGQHLVFVKGAPERVLAMCRDMLTDAGPVPLDARAIHEAARALAARGMRVLAMASGALHYRPSNSTDIAEPAGLTFLGLQGMMDPPRAGVREAIAGCREAGMRVIMITGDHAATAQAIARELGLADDSAPVLTGTDLEKMDDTTLRQLVREVNIYARVAPEHKLRIVRALQHHGHVVAVTGDGVNDAPALRAADIGIAMGRSGTDVAREAADIVLADDNFISIYAAVEEGRVAFDNVRKVTFFLISGGAAEILAILVALVLRWPLVLLPAQLLWINLVTNGLQDVALAFEPKERDVLKRPPRGRGEGIVSGLLWERTVIAGLVMATAVLLLFRWELDQTGSLTRAQTVAMTTLVLALMFHVGMARSEHESAFRMNPFSNPFLFIATTAALVVHIAALYFPPTQYVLRVEPIEPETWSRMALAAATIIVAMELHKLLRRRRQRAPSRQTVLPARRRA